MIIYSINNIDLKPYKLMGYANNNYAGNFKDKKSVIEYCFLIIRVVISWCSKKEQTVFTFIIKLEYIVLDYIVRKSM